MADSYVIAIAACFDQEIENYLKFKQIQFWESLQIYERAYVNKDFFYRSQFGGVEEFDMQRF